MAQRIAYVWMGLSGLMVIIPLGWIVWILSKKLLALWNEKSASLKAKKEIKEMKAELEEQQDEILTNNEYGSFISEKKESEEIKEAGDMQPESETPIPEKESPEKLKKKIDTLLLEANMLKNIGKLEEYEKKLIEGLTIDDESLLILRPLSDLYFALGNYKKALSLLKKVSEKDPSDHRVIWQIAEIYFVAGYHQTAELLLEKAIDLKNDNPKYYLTMVDIYYSTERFQEALAYMEKIIKLRPTNPKYLLATAELYEQVGDLDNAKKYYFNVLEYDAHNDKAKAKIKSLSGDWA